MSYKSIFAAALLLSSANGQTATYQVGFPLNHYDVLNFQEFTVPIRISPLPESGLFSYGVYCTVEGSGGLAGVVLMTPLSALGFDGVLGPGIRGIESGTGTFAGKGSVDIQLPGKSNHTDPILGNLSIAGLPEGTYTLRLALHNTLGPTESVFVDGQSQPLDTQLEFGTATLNVVSAPTGTIRAVSAMTPDRQTGLLIQEYEIENTGDVAAVFRILIKNLPNVASVWNSQGKIDGVPYIDLPAPLPVGAITRITIEYRSQDRSTIPEPAFELIGVNSNPVTPEGATSTIKPRATLSSGNVLLEFDTEEGKSYFIQYSGDLTTWKTALPKVDGTGNRVQWIDNGSPKTESKPSEAASRFYRILATQTAP